MCKYVYISMKFQRPLSGGLETKHQIPKKIQNKYKSMVLTNCKKKAKQIEATKNRFRDETKITKMKTLKTGPRKKCKAASRHRPISPMSH